MDTPLSRGGFIASISLAIAILAVWAVPGLAATGHTFDPQLSLTGGCTTSEDDPLPDPGCPYPPPPASPSENFNRATGVTTDTFGNVYVLNMGPKDESNPHMDIFDADGFFITEVSEGFPASPRTVAVDSAGYLYVHALGGAKWQLLRYDPDPLLHDPELGQFAWDMTPTVLVESFSNYSALAVNPENDHLFVNLGVASPSDGLGAIVEFGSGLENSPMVDSDVADVCCFDGPGLAIDAARDRLYATDQASEPSPRVIRVFELAAPHDLIETIDGSSTPEGSFVTGDQLSIAVDESTGNLFAYEQQKLNLIYELTENGEYLSTIEHNLLSQERHQQVAVDNGANSPNGALNTEGRYVWATATPPGVSHAYAFKPTLVQAPEVKALTFGDVSEDEALLKAMIDSGQAETSYKFEYVSKTQFDKTGFDGAQVAGEGSIPAGPLPVSRSAQATGLAPGTSYVFRIVVANEIDTDEASGAFSTYPAITKTSCPNDQFRMGPSAALPDCRAYELVTPPDTGGRPPMGLGLLSLPFPSLPASPDGSRVSFRIENGLIPGFEGTGSFAGDPYMATRGSGGWSTVATGGDGTQATAVAPGGRSPDQTYSVWVAEDEGPAVVNEDRTIYLRYPDGHSELLGQGSLDVDPQPGPKLISEDGGHVIFTSSIQLEDEAPATGQQAVYDRTDDGITHVASLLPEDVPTSGSQAVSYRGSSLDGLGIAFQVTDGATKTLYLRYNNEETYKVGEDVTSAGIALEGKRIFYLKNGSLFAFDIEDGVIPFATSGDVTVANVSPDGTTAYLVSPSKLTPNANPLGKKAVAGKSNLYQSREGTVHFIATVSEEDVDGETTSVPRNGLGLWVSAVGGDGGKTPGSFAADPSRTSSDGSVLLFQSNANLTAYDSDGRRQIYRYDSSSPRLTCLSCNPTGAPPIGDALLQDVEDGFGPEDPNTVYDVVQNLSADGQRAFFQSPDPLVAADTNGLQDVYEWEAEGVGTCTTVGGCVYLISSGRSGKINYLYAASAGGDDVFFRTSDLLRGEDREAIPSLYDARVGGGFPESASAECEGEGCRPQLTPAPLLPSPGMSPGKSGNVKPGCPKGKRQVRRHGKVRCVKRKSRKRSRSKRSATKSTGVGK